MPSKILWLVGILIVGAFFGLWVENLFAGFFMAMLLTLIFIRLPEDIAEMLDL